MRLSQIAGSWYPGQRDELRGLVTRLLEQADVPKLPCRPFGVISPHAGIQFSGAAAACAYRPLQEAGVSRVLLLGPSHVAPLRGIATSGVSGYRTPLGDVPVDREVTEALSAHPLFQASRRAEQPEHSLEMQLPFLQCVLEEFSIVPLIVGEMHMSDYATAAAALQPYLDGATVVAVSSDFTHFGPRFGYTPFRGDVKQKLRELDGTAIDLITAGDFDGFLSYLDRTGATICGARPIGVLLRLLPEGARGTLLSYYTSGDLLGDYSDTVSYAAIAFTRAAA